MSSPLTDPTIIRAFILHDALLEIPVFEGYRNLQKIVGADVFSYADYDFWYHRFYGGNLDFNYDRSADPSPPMLDKLPFDVLDVIVGNLDAKNRFKVRKVSKTMLQVVDRLKTVYNRLEIRFFKDLICLIFGNEPTENIKYIGQPDGWCVIEKYYRTFRIQGDFLTIGLYDLSIWLNSPKLHIVRFTVDDEDSEAFQQVLGTVKAAQTSEIHVKRAVIRVKNNQHAMELVAMLKPGALERLRIQISKQKEFEKNSLSTLKDMEQFRQLKSVDLHQFGAIPADELQHFYGFKRFQVLVKTISSADVLSLRENLSKPDNQMKFCSIKFQTAPSLAQIQKAIGVQDRERFVNYSIANSKFELEFQISTAGMTVWKVDTTLTMSSAYNYDSDDDNNYIPYIQPA